MSSYHWIGTQYFKDLKIELYNLDVSFSEHPRGSTVTEPTLRQLGIWEPCKCSVKYGKCQNHGGVK